MHTAAQLLADRCFQCDAAIHAEHGSTSAYALLDGIGASRIVRDWTRAAAQDLARAAAMHGDAAAALRAEYQRHAIDPDRAASPSTTPAASAVVAVTTPGKPTTVAWCGNAIAYAAVREVTGRITDDDRHQRGTHRGVMAFLGSTWTDEDLIAATGHPAIRAATVPDARRLLLLSDGAHEPLVDHLIMLSDGVQGPQTERTIGRYLSGPIDLAARRLTRDAVALRGEGADNASALIVGLC